LSWCEEDTNPNHAKSRTDKIQTWEREGTTEKCTEPKTEQTLGGGTYIILAFYENRES